MKKDKSLWRMCLVCIMACVCMLPVVGQQRDTITFLSFNDFHGAFAKDNNTPGAAVFVNALTDVAKQSPHPVVLSGGDNFSGSYFARITRGCPIDRLFSEANVTVSAVGNHEFDWGQAFLVDTAAKSIRYLAANIISDKGNSTLFSPYQLLDVVMAQNDTLTVGIIGVTTTETGRKTNPEYIKGLKFVTPNEAVKTYVEQLRKNGADMVVALMHVGTEMKDGKPFIKEVDADKVPDMVDALMTAHSHNLVLGVINGKPVIQAGTNGTHIGKLQFGVSKDTMGRWNIQFLSGDTIRVPLDGSANKAMEHVVDSINQQYQFNSVLAYSSHQMIHDRTVNAKEYTEVGALVTAAYADCFDKSSYKSDGLTVGVNHFNGIRAGLPAGNITKLQLGNVLPFGGRLKAYKFTGETLKQLLNEGRRNPNGMLQTSNLRLYVDAQGQIVRICKLNGEELKNTDCCVVVCDDFIANGGDGYDKSLFNNEVAGFDMETTQAFLAFVEQVHDIPLEAAQCPVLMDGSQEHPYEIASKADLIWLRNEVENGYSQGVYYRQTSDIDLSADDNWQPIGTRQKPFQGCYDGAGHTVSNIKCKQSDVAGLFGAMVGKNASIANLTSGELGGDNSDIAGKTAAGICAYIKEATIRNCRNNALIHDAGYYETTLGGICGYSHNGTLSYCVNYQTIYSNSSSSAVVAGVLATNAFGAKMENCLNYGNIVNTTMQTGGVCAVSNVGTITTCFNMGIVSGAKAENGAICGWNNGDIIGCHYWKCDKVKGIGGGKEGNAFAETQKRMEELIMDLFSR